MVGRGRGTDGNLIWDPDDLIVHLNGRTLDALYEACASVEPDDEPEVAARALAESYIRFTRDYPKLWNIVFEHHLPDGRELPEWHGEKIGRLLGLLEQTLAPLFVPGQEAERLHSARVLWSSLHGICSLESTAKLVGTESVEALSDSLISNYLAGLRSNLSQSTSA